MRHPGVTCLMQPTEVLPWHLWHRLSSSSSFISLPWLIIKALSHFLISVFCSVRQDLAIGILFLVYLSLQQGGMKEIAHSLANGRATTSLQRELFSLGSLTLSLFTVSCSFLVWVTLFLDVAPGCTFFPYNITRVFSKINNPLEPFISDTGLMVLELH